VRHGRDGALGIVINQPVGEQPVAKLLEASGRTSRPAPLSAHP